MGKSFVQLNRTFQDVTDESDTSSIVAMRMREHHYGATTWTKLYDSKVVVILAAAQAGKSEELRQQKDCLLSVGNKALYIPLVELAAHGLPDSLTPEEEGSFNEWLEGNDTLTLFLDSIDECRLAGQTLQTALTKLSRAISGAEHRTKVILTSRILDWKWQEDDRTVRSILSSIIGKSAPNADQKANEPFRIVALKPLNLDQIKLFSAQRGLADIENFVDEILQKGVRDLASRPLELDGLISYWAKESRLGNYTDIIRELITKRLKETSTKLRDKLTFERLCEGVQLLAAALTLTKQTALLTPDCPEEIKEKGDALDPADILSDWGQDEVVGLMDRAIFDEVSIGKVRLHRTYQEFLTAEWLLALLNKPGGRRAVTDLLFLEKNGIHFIPPTFKATAGWLGNWDDKICSGILEIEPENLIANGDPGTFSKDIRTTCLKLFAEKYADQSDTGVSFDITALGRFKADDLHDVLREVLDSNPDHEDIEDLVMRLTWVQKLSSLVERFTPYFSPRKRRYYNNLVIRIVSEAGNKKQKDDLIARFLKDAELFEEKVAGEFVECFYPNTLTTQQVIQIIQRREIPNEKISTGLKYHLELVTSDIFELGQAIELLSALIGLAQQKPHLQERHINRISGRYFWLHPLIKILAAKLLELHHTEELCNETMLETLDLLARFKRAHFPGYSSSKEISIQNLLNQHPSLKRLHLWNFVETQRQHANDDEVKRNAIWGWDYYPVDIEDTHWLLDDANHHPDDLCKIIAFNLLMQLCTHRENPSFDKMCQLADSNKIFAPSFQTWTSPVDVDQEKLDYKRERLAREREEEKAEIARKKRFIQNKHKLSIIDLARIAHWYGESGNDTYGCQDWRTVVSDLDEPTAIAFRDGCKKFWRSVTPLLPCERERGDTGVDTLRYTGLSGLNFEAQDKRWPSHLNEQEIVSAARFATLELNGFPAWFLPLAQKYPSIIVPVFMKQIEHELKFPENTEYIHSFFSSLKYADKNISSLFVAPIENLIKQCVPQNKRVRYDAFDLLFKHENINSSLLLQIAIENFTNSTEKQDLVFWMTVWLNLDAIPALDTLERYLDTLDDHGSQDFFVALANLLSNRHDPGLQCCNPSYLKLQALIRFIPLVFSYIRVEDDQVHEGTYSPDARDNAESFRGLLFSSLCDTPGKESYLAILHLATLPLFSEREDRFKCIAVEKIVKESDTPIWSLENIKLFIKSLMRSPTNSDDLFLTCKRCLEDIKLDLEDGDASIASLVKRAELESEVQAYFKNKLDDVARGRFTAVREEEVVNQTFPDIRVSHPDIRGPIGIEIKIAENWSGAELQERLFNQLIGQYLRAADSRHGIFLLTFHGKKKHWEEPGSKKKLTFPELLSWLEEEAAKILPQLSGVDNLLVLGIDLTQANNHRPLFDKIKKSLNLRAFWSHKSK